MKKILLPILGFLFLLPGYLQAQEHSVARKWNEMLLESIRNDLARPTVHARNLFHVSAAMWDAWAVYDDEADTWLLGNTVGGYTCAFDGIPAPADVYQAREEAISYAAYRLLQHRFQFSPGGPEVLPQYDTLMMELGYDIFNFSQDYSSGDPAALGNYIAQSYIDFGFQDGSNEADEYQNQFYEPVNPPLVVNEPGNPTILDYNRWQPLALDSFVDQSGNPIPTPTPLFLSPEWGQVIPFSLKEEDRTIYTRDGFDYWVYHDPGIPPYLDTNAVGGISEEYKWTHSLVAIWSSHLDPTDGVMWDISPASIGNNGPLPLNFEDYHDFYNRYEGGDQSQGWDVNPHTGLPYEPQIVPRGDYARVLAEFWADGPHSETPPGHWYTILNYVSDNPDFEKRYRGEGDILDDLEWDVKSYFLMGGTLHDVAITAWGIKGWYDYVRPVSAIRGMAELGQSSDPGLPNYHPGGMVLEPGYVELIQAGDTLAGLNNEHVGKIKIFAWRGPFAVPDPATTYAGAGWIRAEDWWPYQRPSFVTPPFAGFISGHSTYSRAAAELMTLLTGDAFFPGGMGVFDAPINEYLVFEDGPSFNIELQWATYRDASDQCSLSRIWGGIHPPADDIPGRLIGAVVGVEAFLYAETYFYDDADEDGYNTFFDCDDTNETVYPGAAELCDGLDNNCNGDTDEDLEIFNYYADTDGDGYGDELAVLDTCALEAPIGFVTNSDDCDDTNNEVNPDAEEIVDGIDNDCNDAIDDGVGVITTLLGDWDNHPNPVQDVLLIGHPNYGGGIYRLYHINGQLASEGVIAMANGNGTISFESIPSGVYLLNLFDESGQRVLLDKAVKK